MGNFQREGIPTRHGEVIIGPETVNGTGEVYLDADAVRILSNEETRKLAAALIEAADYAKARQGEMLTWPGRRSATVLSAVWTDQDWRSAAEAGRKAAEEALGEASGER